MSKRRNITGPIDTFSLSPLLALLPSFGKPDKLEGLSASIFARHERVQAQKNSTTDDVSSRKFNAEEGMLRQVLEWLDMKPGNKED